MVDILLATYNGGKYITQQIDSIINQTYTNWRLIVSDDCSSDDTVEIVRKFAEKYPNKIILFQNDISSRGAKNNFFNMVKYADSEYIMFCDQDDIWLENKIHISLNKMVECEMSYGFETPILIHTDLKIVDENLNVISESMFKYQSLNSENNTISNILVQNNVTGCTMMVNQKLLSMLKKDSPPFAIMHDWWLTLIAVAFGKVVFIDKATILYRQHGMNQVGAKHIYNIRYIIDRIKNQKIKETILDTYKQAECFLDIYFKDLDIEKKKIVLAYIKMPTLNKLNRIIYLKKYHFFKSSFVRKIGQVIYI